jgi:hypothetical protein
MKKNCWVKSRINEVNRNFIPHFFLKNFSVGYWQSHWVDYTSLQSLVIYDLLDFMDLIVLSFGINSYNKSKSSWEIGSFDNFCCFR